MKFNYFKNGCRGSKKADSLLELKQICQMYVDPLVNEYRNTGDKSIKERIPAFCPLGTFDLDKERKIDNMTATGFCMIDLDHMPEMELAVLIGLVPHFKERTLLVYITCSGKGLRIIFPKAENYDLNQSAIIFMLQNGLEGYLKYLDTVVTDLSRISILTKTDDYLFVADDTDNVKPLVPNEDEIYQLEKIGDVKTYISNLKKGTNKDTTKKAATSKDDNKPSAKDSNNVEFKNYKPEQIEENDKLYGSFMYKGRRICEITNTYIIYKTRGRGPEAGERHSLYNQLCKNFRNLCDNDPRILHAILPALNHPIEESWKQCCYFTAVNKSTLIPKDFYFWLKNQGFLEDAEQDIDNVISEEDAKYDEFLKSMPSMPPIIREFVKIAPKWFKLPVISSLQCYCALLATNYRAYFYDGLPISTTLYSLIYAPAASGKSYVKRLKTILKSTDERDMLAMNKAKWYDKQQRENNGSGKLPSEVVWKQRLFASKTSLGEILKRQEAIGQHHWMQDVAEFSIWAATIKKQKEEWSAFFRTSYDNEEFMQSYQSANAYRGKVAVYPIVHGTCTVGQIKSFFTNIEDGLLTRFSFVPLLHQVYAKYQPWKIMSDKDQQTIDKVVARLDAETYKSDVSNEEDNWDYDFKDPIFYKMDYLYEPILDWLEEKRSLASKDDNQALDTFRKRCARNAFVFGLVCRALWGRDDKATRKKIIDCMLWDAEVKLYYMRYLWENVMLQEMQNERSGRKKLRNGAVFDDLPETFDRGTLENMLINKGYKTPIKHLISNWKANGYIKETSKFTYKKSSTK